uniref:F-box/kelch-repeat protein n=1 Tax=Noccaea caerulescens TaxID=107243 RepID=A0A1J3HCI9_NOCCA
MRTGRRRYTAETPASLLPEALTMKPIVQAPSSKEKKKKKKKCIITGLWDVIIPSELLQEILSRVGPKGNIQASVVCKTWFEAAVSVRKLPPLPWLFYPLEDKDGDYIIFDPLRSQTYKKNVPDLKDHGALSCSRDGWLLVAIA